MIALKVNHIHNNSVAVGFVNEPHEWKLSSPDEQSLIKVLIQVGDYSKQAVSPTLNWQGFSSAPAWGNF